MTVEEIIERFRVVLEDAIELQRENARLRRHLDELIAHSRYIRAAIPGPSLGAW